MMAQIIFLLMSSKLYQIYRGVTKMWSAISGVSFMVFIEMNKNVDINKYPKIGVKSEKVRILVTRPK